MSLTLDAPPEARLAKSALTRRVAASLDYVVPHGRIALITGAVGLGKSTALRAALAGHALPTTWVDLPPVYTPKELIRWIYLDVVGDPEDFPQRDLQDDLIVELSERPRVIVVRNAERLTKESAGQLEWLHGRSPGWPLYFVGLPGARSRILTEPHLDHAIAEVIEAAPLSTTELFTVLPNIHPLFLGASPDLIARIDKALTGNLGRWMAFLHRALHIRDLAARAQNDVPSLDLTLARAVMRDLPNVQRKGTKR